MSHQKNEEEDCRKQKAPRGVSLWSVLIFLPLFSHLWQYIFSLIYLKLLSHMKTCFLNHCSPTVFFFNLVHPCFPQLLSLVYHINCHWFSSNCFLTGFNHLLYFLITRSIKILIRAPGQVLVKPKILVNRRSLYPPTISKVCLFLEILDNTYESHLEALQQGRRRLEAIAGHPGESHESQKVVVRISCTSSSTLPTFHTRVQPSSITPSNILPLINWAEVSTSTLWPWYL